MLTRKLEETLQETSQGKALVPTDDAATVALPSLSPT